MGFLDKAKEAADRAVAATQHAAQQGQAKIESAQASRSENELYRALGEAFFNEQRRSGDRAPVVEALGALDQHFAAAPPPPSAPGTVSDPTAGAPPTQPPPAATAAPPPAAPAGNFTLDDM